MVGEQLMFASVAAEKKDFVGSPEAAAAATVGKLCGADP